MSEQDNYQQNSQHSQQSSGLSPDAVKSYLQNGLEPTMRMIREGANNAIDAINSMFGKEKK